LQFAPLYRVYGGHARARAIRASQCGIHNTQLILKPLHLMHLLLLLLLHLLLLLLL